MLTGPRGEPAWERARAWAELQAAVSLASVMPMGTEQELHGARPTQTWLGSSRHRQQQGLTMTMMLMLVEAGDQPGARVRPAAEEAEGHAEQASDQSSCTCGTGNCAGP